MTTAKFPVGRLVTTPGALNGFTLDEHLVCLQRHVVGDWGDLDDEDKAHNNAALVSGDRLLSAYNFSDDRKLWIITEGVDDEGRRSATTLLLPSEY
jgi:hypothetical protein